MQSAETAKHVTRTMAANARAGFWNGSIPPLGYRVEVTEIRGPKEKKKLVIDAEASETVRLIYILYLKGDGCSGPLGIKKITVYLNDRDYRTPRGGRYQASYVEKILKSEVYIGRFYYRRDVRRGNKTAATMDRSGCSSDHLREAVPRRCS